MMPEINRETGVAFLMVTHDERLAQAADRILMIEDGYVHEADTGPSSARERQARCHRFVTFSGVPCHHHIETQKVADMKRARKERPGAGKASLGSVGDIMSAKVVSVEPQQAANVAWSRMQRRDVRHLVVMDNGGLRGIISERDLSGRNDRRGRMVQDVMTPRVVSAESDTTLEQAANLIGKRRIGCLPVLDDGQLVGIVTATDVFDELERRSSRAPFPGWVPRPVKVESGRAAAPLIPAHIRLLGAEIGKKDRARLREKLGAKLGKFAESIERVSVRVKDVNGPRGGVDQVCQIKVVLSGLPSVVFEARNASLDLAISKALAGAERAVRQSLQRRRMEPMKAQARSRPA
jgi:CBS domain-containing protein